MADADRAVGDGRGERRRRSCLKTGSCEKQAGRAWQGVAGPVGEVKGCKVGVV